MELVERKRKLIENYGYVVKHNADVTQWAVIDARTPNSYAHIGSDYDAVIEVGFWRVAWEIAFDLRSDVLSPEEAVHYFKGTEGDLEEMFPPLKKSRKVSKIK